MPDTLLREEPTDLAREAGSAVVNARHRLRNGITGNRSELLILAGTVVFVVLVALLGVALISAA